MINYSLPAEEGREASVRCDCLFQERSRSGWSPRAKWDLAERSSGSREVPPLRLSSPIETELEWSSPRNIAVLGLTEKSRKCHRDLVNISFSISSLLPCFRGVLWPVYILELPSLFSGVEAVEKRNQIAFALKSLGLASHLISLFKGGLEKKIWGKTTRNAV